MLSQSFKIENIIKNFKFYNNYTWLILKKLKFFFLSLEIINLFKIISIFKKIKFFQIYKLLKFSLFSKYSLPQQKKFSVEKFNFFSLFILFFD